MNLFTIVLVLNRVDRTAWSRSDGEVKLGVLAVATGIAQEWVFLIVVDRPVNRSNSNSVK